MRISDWSSDVCSSDLNMSGLFQSAYGQLLLIKLVLFGLMLALAASNRFSLTPALATGIEDGNIEGAVLRLSRIIWLEGGQAGRILALGAWLGTLLPQASDGCGEGPKARV